MLIAIDTREQSPYDFAGYDVQTQPGALTAGDYSVPGFFDEIAIERKELSDLLGCLTHDRDRFMRELDRLRGYRSAAIVVEAPLSRIMAGKYRSHIPPAVALQSLLSIMANYRIPILFADDREAGERYTYDLLRHFLRHEEQRYRAIVKQGSIPP